MTCGRYSEEKIFAYAAGELDAAEADEIKAHIGECEACGRLSEECRQILSDINDSGEEVPGELLSGVMAKVRGSGKRGRAALWRKVAVIAACVAIVAAMTAGLLSDIAGGKNGGSGTSYTEPKVRDGTVHSYSRPESEKEKLYSAEDIDDGEVMDADAYPAQVAEATCDTSEPICPVHRNCFHTIPRELIDYAGEENYTQWLEDAGEEKDGCPPQRLLDFIIYFSIPDGVITECFENGGFGDLEDIGVLLGRDPAQWEEYCLK